MKFGMPIVIMTFLVGCGKKPDVSTTRLVEKPRPRIVVFDYPTEYCAKDLVGHYVDVQNLKPVGVDLNSWKPNDGASARIRQSDLVLVCGPDAVEWAKRIGVPAENILDTTIGFKNDLIRVTHPGEAAQRDAGNPWLDLTQLEKMIIAIRLSVDQRGYFPVLPDGKRNLFGMEFQEFVKITDTIYKGISQKAGMRKAFSNSTGFAYFARRYSLHIKQLNFDASQPPTLHQLESLSKEQTDHPAKVFIWNAEAHPDWIDALQKIGLKSVTIDTCQTELPGKSLDDRIKSIMDTLLIILFK